MKIVIVGAGSTAEALISVLIHDRNFEIIGFTDKEKKCKGKKIMGLKAIGSHDILKRLYNEGVKGAVIAIGYDNNLREKYFHKVKEMGYEMINVIHPSAIVDQSAVLSEGIVIGPGSIISPMVRIDRNSILEPGVVVGAHTQIADNVYIGVGSCISGSSFIKRNAFLGAGCSIAPFVTIGKNARISPGASVNKDVADKLRKNKA